MTAPMPDHVTLEDAAKAVERLRVHFLLGSDCGENLTPFAEQHYLAALAQLDGALRSLRLAALTERRDAPQAAPAHGESCSRLEIEDCEVRTEESIRHDPTQAERILLAEIDRLRESVREISHDRLSRHLADQRKLEDTYGTIDELAHEVDCLRSQLTALLAAASSAVKAWWLDETGAGRLHVHQRDALRTAIADLGASAAEHDARVRVDERAKALRGVETLLRAAQPSDQCDSRYRAGYALARTSVETLVDEAEKEKR